MILFKVFIQITKKRNTYEWPQKITPFKRLRSLEGCFRNEFNYDVYFLYP